MKPILMLILYLLPLLHTFEQQNNHVSQLSKGKIYFKKALFYSTKVDFPRFKAKQGGVGIILFINVSKQPLIIRKITQECSCIKLIPDNNIVNPGEKGVLTLKMISPPVGLFRKMAYIFFEREKKPVPILVTGRFI